MSATFTQQAVEAAVGQLPPIAHGIRPELTAEHAAHHAAETVRGLIATQGLPAAQQWAATLAPRHTAPGAPLSESPEAAMMIEACQLGPGVAGLGPLLRLHLSQSKEDRLASVDILLNNAAGRVSAEAYDAEAVRAAWRTCAGPIGAALIAQHGRITSSHKYTEVKRMWHLAIWEAVEAGVSWTVIAEAFHTTPRTISNTLKRGRDYEPRN